MKRLVLAVAVIVPAVSMVIAQDSIVGTWHGGYSFLGKRNTGNMGVQLNIASVENGVVKGTATLLSTTARCAGEYPMEGRLEENKLSMRATAKGGRDGDCSFNLHVVREGNTLTGTTVGGSSLKLSR